MAANALPEVRIILDTRLEDIAQGPSCNLCGFPTEKFFAEDHLMTGVNVQVRALRVASYRCSRGDGAVIYSYKALVESLTRGAEIMQQHGDSVTPVQLQQSIQRYREVIEEQRLTGLPNILRASL